MWDSTFDITRTHLPGFSVSIAPACPADPMNRLPVAVIIAAGFEEATTLGMVSCNR